MKKIISTALSIMLIAVAVSTAYATGPESAGKANYKDLKTTNWAYESVNAISQVGIIKGYQDGTFRPQGVITYGEFIKMAVIAATKEDVGRSDKGHWATNYYNQALGLKYFGVTDIKADQLSYPISRADMALIISNILGETKIDNYSELENSLKDINSTVKNDYDIIKVYAKGIITGYQDGTFKPENTLTRAESATVIYRLLDESKRVLPEEKKEDVVTEDKTSGTDIASVIKNYRTYEQKKIALGYGSLLAEATSYEFVTDMSEYKVTDIASGRYKWVEVNGEPTSKLGWGNMYLMKDNEIVEFSGDGKYTGDITTIEYFVFPSVDHVIRIMPNPLYKNK